MIVSRSGFTLPEQSGRSLVASYERRIEKLSREKLLLAEKLGTQPKATRIASQEFEPPLRFLENPMNLWRSDKSAHKQAVMKMLFEGRSAYKKKEGVRAPIYTCPVKALAAISAGKSEMAHMVEKTSNRLFETLEDWNTCLKEYASYLHKHQP